MDDQRFDQIVRALQHSGSRRSAITALLGGIGIALTPGMAPGAEAKKSAKKRGKRRRARRGKSRAEAIDRRSIEICHAPGTPDQQTMVIPRTQLNAHMRHGDAIGPCQTCAPATCQSLGKTCGAWPDGCEGTLQCGSCTPAVACQTSTCSNGTCAVGSITGQQAPGCTGSGDLCCGGRCVDTDSDDFHCGGCNKNCLGIKVGSECRNGACVCPPDSQECGPIFCKQFCSARVDVYRDRFQFCYTSDPSRQGNCAACISWADCIGPLATGVPACGTVNGTC